jgi:hypothetical protein
MFLCSGLFLGSFFSISFCIEIMNPLSSNCNIKQTKVNRQRPRRSSKPPASAKIPWAFAPKYPLQANLVRVGPLNTGSTLPWPGLVMDFILRWEKGLSGSAVLTPSILAHTKQSGIIKGLNKYWGKARWIVGFNVQNQRIAI